MPVDLRASATVASRRLLVRVGLRVEDRGCELAAAGVDVDAAAHARRCRYPVLCQYVHEHLPRRGLGSWEVRSEG